VNFEFLKVTVGVIVTLGLYSVLYRETKVYRFFEHIFLGLAAGFTLVAVWKETLRSLWWDKIAGSIEQADSPAVPGYWAYILLLPIALCGYTVFSKKHNWMSRIPIGLLLGFWSGQQVQVWWNKWGTQIYSSMKPVLPTTWDRFTVPTNFDGLSAVQVAQVGQQVYPSQAINNFVFVATILCVLSYFFFSLEIKNRVLKSMNTTGRWLLMVGFGAIFGSTVMAKFALVIDRMFLIFIEWGRDGLFRLFT